MTSVPRVISDAAIRHLQQAVEWPDAGERYDVREMIGQGGMGRVYRVYDRLLDRELALKALSLESETPELTARLTHEARVLAKLEHPGIAAIHDAGSLADGRPYYLMRFVRGKSLTDPSALGARGDRLRAFLRICDAVSFAHARGIVHRDLKPGNVMTGEYGDVVVLDWGIAKVLSDDEDMRDGTVVGTPGFMSPEQAAGTVRAIDTRADVFGLGALLQHLLTANGTALHEPQLPRPLSAIVAKAMASEPANRYQQVNDLAADVRRWLDAEPVAAYRESIIERSARFYERNRTLLLLLLAYAIVRIAILWWRGV